MAVKFTWRIVDQVRDQVINTRAGQTIVGTYVYYLTGDGNEGSVFVPDARYNLEQVKDQVAAEAKKQDTIGRQFGEQA